ncbi:alpha/beta fold hydrolase [Echinicola jeungdonensis]|nr:alpha/beta fold hydrolase [Echinicola jeungdonensis]MDN3670456.1 alpha/beta fold hydrolase [Echinicola jeungdonensis]
MFQEKLLFFPTKLSKSYVYNFDEAFEEIFLVTNDGYKLNAVLFKSEISIGVVLFLHGNGGAINGWGKGAELYTKNGYDVLYLDYRGYGKSEGEINSEKQLINDAQIAYDYLKNHYDEYDIIISGTSLGSGIASKLASNNNPKKLILNSPFSSLVKLIQEKVIFVPRRIIKYKLETEKYLEKIDCPIIIFHGDNDRVVPVNHSLYLKEKFPKINLYVLKGFEHNNISQSDKFQIRMKEILE